ncbi:MAG: heavy metal translocating P-type ATPase [Bacteroidota bacterium]
MATDVHAPPAPPVQPGPPPALTEAEVAPHHGCSCHAPREPHGPFGTWTELVYAGLSGAFLLAGWGLETFTAMGHGVTRSLLLVSYGLGGYYTARGAYQALRRGRFEIDTLMLVAAAGAAALGAWAEGALLLFLFSLGHALEHLALGRARRAIEALADLAPDTALVRRDGLEREVRVEDLAVGDVVVVRTHERLPADGFVVAGRSAVDQAPITGESVPVTKHPVDDPVAALADPAHLASEHRVFAGTINGSGGLEIMVTHRASESTLARVVRMVTAAQTKTSPTQRFTQRFERIFVPAVLGFVVLLLFAWVVIDEPFSDSFYRAMAVLVASSPCALAIATPSAVLSGVARAGRGGVLIKGGGPLEELGTLTAIAFDKTGTLTEGRPAVTNLLPTPGVDAQTLLQTAQAVERQSDHPLARALVRHRMGPPATFAAPTATDVQSLTGLGVRAVLNGTPVLVGKPALFAQGEGPPLPDALHADVARLERAGRTTVIVRHGASYLGVIGLMDAPRPAAPETVEALRALGVTRLVLLSGDNHRVASAVAQQIGLDEACGNLLPADKADAIRRLRADGAVAMVGDGVNDAPAMAHATVGIAMGAAGSDVALETADVALMGDALERLPFAVRLSRKTRRIIRQNLWISLGMVAVLVPATVMGLNLGPAVALHEGSTLLVVLNALRLLRAE